MSKNQGKGKKGGNNKPNQSTDTTPAAPLNNTTTGTSLGGSTGTSLGGTSLGGTSLGGTSLGGAPSTGTSLGGTSLGGTSLGGSSGTSLGGTSIGGTPASGTSLGGTSLGGTPASGTSLGGTSLGGTSLGGTSLGGTPSTGTSLGGTSLGESSGTSLGGTSLGGTPASGTSLGGTSLGGTSIGGTALGGTALGGTALGGTALGGTSIGGTALGGTALGGTALGGTALGGTSIGGTALGGTALGGTALGGTSIGGTALGGTSIGGTALGGTSIGGTPATGTSLGGTSLGGTSLDGGDDEESEAKKDEGKKPAGGKAEPAKQKAAPAKQAAKEPAKKAEPAKDAKKEPTGPAAKQAKAAAAHVARLKALQQEQEKRRKEEEEQKKREEEEEKKRIEAEKRAEEERQKMLELRKIKREEEKKKQAELEAIRRREEAMKRYGIDPTLVAGLGRGRGARGGRGRGRGGTRGGKGGRADSGATDSDKKESEGHDHEHENEEHGEHGEHGDHADNEHSPEVPAESEAKPEETSAPPTEQSPSAAPEPVKDEIEDWEAMAEGVDNEKKKEEERKKEEEKKEELRKKEEQKKEEQRKREEEHKKKELEKKTREEEKKKREEEEQRKKEEVERQKNENLTKQNAKLRSPIVCVLGHVDTGKTLLLDKIRSSNIQAGEAGGITQQIGATFFPNEVIRNKTKELTEHLKNKLTFKLPGLLIIDTPGHESFSNLRSRGSSLCDIAILVIDLMHGLEPQTKESIRLLKSRNTPFVVALNKVDRVFGWKSTPNHPFQLSFTKQDQATRQRFEERVLATIADLAGEGLNAVLYYQNKDFKKTVSLVPTSAITGEGIPDLLMLLVQLSQNLMSDKLLELSELDCTVLEVKKLAGRGTTLDVILANGILKIGDKIVVCGMNGEPIVTNIRAILTPPLLGEMRAKNVADLVPNKEVRAAIGCKIDAPGLDDAVAGSQLFVVKPGEDVEKYKSEVMKALISLEGKVDKSGFGVYVQCSTLGSMEALLEFLKDVCKIPVSGIRIGPVHKKDVIRASVMLEHKREFACILAFDVKVMPDAREYAENLGVRIFEADIIYHLQEMFQKYLEEVEKEKKDKLAVKVIFPCVLSILPDHIYRARDPIVLGVKVDEGILKVGTPIVIPSKDKIEIGTVRGIRKADKSEVTEAPSGEEVSVEIVPDATKQKYMYDRHFDHNDKLMSLISRNSIDALKEAHPELCKTREIYKLILSLKSTLAIM